MSDGSDKAKKHTVPSRKKVLKEALLPLCVGLVMMFVFDKQVMGRVLMGVSLFVFLSGNFVHPAYKAFMFVINKLVYGLGVGVTWILLAPFFYIFFTFGRIILSITGKDPMKRKFPAEEKSCWIPVNQDRGLERYKQQY